MSRVVVLLIVFGASAPVLATPPATQPVVVDEMTEARLQRLLDQLAHGEAQVRERARYELMGMTRSELAIFRRIVADARPLLPSQFAVLREIVTHAFLSNQAYEASALSGFLGVTFSARDYDELDDLALPAPPQGGVVVTSRMPGFCGYRHLMDGDVLLGLSSERTSVRFRDGGHLGAVVRGFPPGTALRFEVLRHGQVIEVEVTLDARPVEVDRTGRLDALHIQRVNAAGDFWDGEFRRLLEAGVS